MARWTRISAVSAALSLGLVLTACTAGAEPAPTSTAPVVQLGAPGEQNRTLSPSEAAALDSPDYVAADVEFIRDMLHHHSQALVMTGYVEPNTESEDIRLLAERMQTSQEDEMKLMEGWLQSKGEPVRDPDAAHDAHAGMPGLLTDEELASLEAARGSAFDRLFLELMIKHHQGAVQMVVDLREANGGQEVEIGTISQHVEADQNVEIGRMQEMLADRS